MGSEKTAIEDGFVDADLMQVFLEEFEELMDIYKNSLRSLRSSRVERFPIYKEIFRVYHTLKGDTAYFPEFVNITNFVSIYCDELRDLSDEIINDQKLERQLRLNFSRLSAILIQIQLRGTTGGFRL